MLKSLASRVSFWHRAFSFLPVPDDVGSGARKPDMTTLLEQPSTIAPAATIATRRGPRPLPLVCKLCHTPHPPSASATCEECLGPLEPQYDAGRALPNAATIASRPPSLWR